MSRSYKHEPHVGYTAYCSNENIQWWKRRRRHVDRMRARMALAQGDYDTPRHDLGKRYRVWDPGDGKGWRWFRDYHFSRLRRHGRLPTRTWVFERVWVTAEEQFRKARRK